MNVKDVVRVIMSEPSLVRLLAISESQQKLLEHVAEKGFVTAAECAEHFDTSVHSMSGRLKALWRKQYLLRTEDTHPTGGIEYLYSPRILKFDQAKKAHDEAVNEIR